MRWRDESAETLVEVLLTVMIIGIGVTGLLGALGTGVSMSTVQQHHAQAETAVRHAAEAVRAAPYELCTLDPLADYQAATSVVDATVLPLEISHWDGDSFEASCPAVDILQLVTVSVESDDPKVGVVSLQVAKRLTP